MISGIVQFKIVLNSMNSSVYIVHFFSPFFAKNSFSQSSFYVFSEGQLISKWFFVIVRFPSKNKQKQVDLRHHSCKVEFVRSVFGGNR